MPNQAILIEDSETIKNALCEALSELADVEVIATAETAGDGVMALVSHYDEWNIAIVDMFLKSGSGLAVLESVQKRRPDQRVIVLTNYATQDMRSRCLALGADAIFDKSTEFEALFDYCKDAAALH